MTYQEFASYWRTVQHDTRLPITLRTDLTRFLTTEAAQRVSSLWWLLAHRILLVWTTEGLDRFKQTIARQYFTSIESVRGSTDAYTALLSGYVSRLGGIRLPEPLLGEPTLYRDDSQDMLLSSIEAYHLERAIPSKIQTVMELGGGYGRTAWFLCTAYPTVRYTLVDLPPVLHLAHWYLSQQPSTQAVTYLTPDRLASVPDRSQDLVLAIDCLREMTTAQVQHYLTEFGRIGQYVAVIAQTETPIQIPGDVTPWPPAWPPSWVSIARIPLVAPHSYVLEVFRP